MRGLQSRFSRRLFGTVFICLMALTIFVAGQPSGNPSCPCIASFPQAWTDVWVGTGTCSGTTQQFVANNLLFQGGSPNDGYCAPAGYGLSTCSAYDTNLGPYCSVASPPDFCTTPWCYVNATQCFQVTHAPSIRQSLSSLADNAKLYYSYDTCGSTPVANFAKFQAAAVMTAQEVANHVSSYVQALRDEVEVRFEVATTPDVNGQFGVCSPPQLACSCSGCSPGVGSWCSFSDSNVCYSMDPATMTVSHIHQSSSFTTMEQQAHCVASELQGVFKNIALQEWNTPFRMGHIYFGEQRSGSYFNFPGIDLCGFEPRNRDWYANAASGPKDVVIVIDRSASMTLSSRWQAAVNAAKVVLDTLGQFDFVGLVTFTSIGNQYETQLLPATAANKQAMKEYLDQLSPLGSTSFQAAFTKAFNIIDASRGNPLTSSNCNGAILFLTDGVDSSDMDVAFVTSMNAEHNFAIFTYSFGADADATKPKEIACENKGIAYIVPDGGSIQDVMADYFKYFASALSSYKNIRWVWYTEIITNNPLIAGCLSAYNRTSAGDSLLGVVCMDVNLLISVADFQQKTDYITAQSAMLQETQTCYLVSLQELAIEALREAAGGVAARCDYVPPSADLASITGVSMLALVFALVVAQ